MALADRDYMRRQARRDPYLDRLLGVGVGRVMADRRSHRLARLVVVVLLGMLVALLLPGLLSR
jgi:hypothetical protein